MFFRFSGRLLFACATALVFLIPLCRSVPDAEERSRLFQLSKFDTLPEDTNLHADHYPASNERRIDLFRSHLNGLGGGYVGVGTDQNLTFVA